MALPMIILFYIVIVTCQAKILDLSCDQIQSFVDGHNSRRLQLVNGLIPEQPAAVDMKMLVWDEELAEKAQYWSSQNIHQHNPERNVESGRFIVGENLYWYSTTAKSFDFEIDRALASWFDEYKDYNFGPLSASDFEESGGSQIGHYTQMVWSDSTYLGCAVDQSEDGEWNRYSVVCNYGPGGNYLGETPYKTENPSEPVDGLICADRCDTPYGISCNIGRTIAEIGDAVEFNVEFEINNAFNK